MNYEYLIRRAYNCGRHGVAGANADVYRGLERNHARYTQAMHEIENDLPRTWGQDITEMNYNLGVSSGEVSAYISSAIKKVEADHADNLSEEQIAELDNCKAELNSPNMDVIEDILERAETVMLDLGLYPG